MRTADLITLHQILLLFDFSLRLAPSCPICCCTSAGVAVTSQILCISITLNKGYTYFSIVCNCKNYSGFYTGCQVSRSKFVLRLLTYLQPELLKIFIALGPLYHSPQAFQLLLKMLISPLDISDLVDHRVSVCSQTG